MRCCCIAGLLSRCLGYVVVGAAQSARARRRREARARWPARRAGVAACAAARALRAIPADRQATAAHRLPDHGAGGGAGRRAGHRCACLRPVAAGHPRAADAPRPSQARSGLHRCDRRCGRRSARSTIRARQRGGCDCRRHVHRRRRQRRFRARLRCRRSRGATDRWLQRRSSPALHCAALPARRRRAMAFDGRAQRAARFEHAAAVGAADQGRHVVHRRDASHRRPRSGSRTRAPAQPADAAPRADAARHARPQRCGPGE